MRAGHLSQPSHQSDPRTLVVCSELGNTVPAGYYLTPSKQPASADKTGATAETGDRPAFASPAVSTRGVGPTVPTQRRNSASARPAELRLGRVNEDNVQSSVTFRQDAVEFHRRMGEMTQEDDGFELQEFSNERIYDCAL